jgi:hypothetical protein
MTSAFQLHYRKHKYTPESIESALLYDIQNYIPIYRRFFDINESNYKGIQLNQRYYLQNIIEHPTQIMDNNTEYNHEDIRSNSNHGSLNHLETVIGDDAGNTMNVPMFVKYSPLLDPIRYLSGKYESSTYTTSQRACMLPKYNSTSETCEDKMLNTNNSSYVDGFFSYLTSCALHTHGIVHGLDYYGSYLCKQREFSTNVFDDIDYLADCSFFNTYENQLFTIDYSQFDDDESNVSGNKLMKLRNKLQPIMNGGNNNDDYLSTDNYFSKKDRIDILEYISECDVSEISPDVTANTTIPSVTTTAATAAATATTTTAATDVVSAGVLEINIDDFDIQRDHQEHDTVLHPKKNTRDYRDDNISDSDTSQSNSSYTTIDDDDDGEGGDGDGSEGGESDSEGSEGSEDSEGDNDDQEDNDKKEHNRQSDRYESDEESSDYSDDNYSDDEQIIVKIKDFPIQAILLEKCVSTLDNIMMRDELTKEEWTSLLFQVIMTLVIYQKMFAFTHNDLHTNNIMFIETTEEFIYYIYEDQHYKVPTYGRIFKIIDFGRAIYKFRGELICSDSFHPKGDAATQYNFPPYYNPNKPIVEPNYSFDLCRFACALFDYFIYDINKVEKLSKSDPIIKMVVKWTLDDKGRNVLYKSSGEERYPDFKLYKMISRSVHNHVPSNEIHNPIFDEYKITYKKYKKHASLAAKFLKEGKNTHILINVDTLPCYAECVK